MDGLQINQADNKTFKIKIRNDTTKQHLQDKLKEQFQSKQLYLSFYKNEETNEFLSLIASQMCDFKNIQTFSLKVNEVKQLDLNKILAKLQDLEILESFSLRLKSYYLGDCDDSITIGDSIKNLSNLKSLKLDIDCENIPKWTQLFRLEPAFQKLKELNNLSINLQSVSSNNLLSSIFRGIKLQANLKSLNLQLWNYDVSTNQDLNILKQELVNLQSLNALEICIQNSYNNKQTNYSSIILHSNFNLQNLQKLKLSIPLQPSSMIDFENLKLLTSLKCLAFEQITDISIQDQKYYLDTISELPYLESVELVLKIDGMNNKEPYLSKLVTYLNKIPIISELKIELSFFNEITNSSFLKFLNDYENKNNLKKLAIKTYSSCNDSYLVNDQELNEIQNSFKNLNSIDIEIYEWEPFDQIQLVGMFWVNVLKNISQLENLQLNLNQPSDLECSQGECLLNGMLLNKPNIKNIFINLGRFYQTQQDDLIKFIDSLSEKKNLEEFNLITYGNRNFQDELLISVGSTIKNIQNLITLNIQLGKNNQFTTQGFYHLCKGLKDLVQLKNLSLILQKVSMNFQDINNLFQIMINKKQLSSLKVKLQMINTNNDLKQKDDIILEKFPCSLKQVSMQIKCKGLKYQHVRNFFLGMRNSKNLHILKTCFLLQYLQDEELEEIAGVFQSLKSLQYLLIDLNQLSFMKMISRLQSLKFQRCIELKQKNYNEKFLKVEEKATTSFVKIMRYNIYSQTNCDEEQKCQINFDSKDNEEEIIQLTHFFQSTSVHSLEFAMNNSNLIDEHLAIILFQSFQLLTTLKILIFTFKNGIKLQNLSFGELGKSLKSLPQLEQLTFNMIQVDLNEHLHLVLNQLEHSTKLQKLELQMKSIEILQFNIIMHSIINMKQVRQLKIEVKESFVFDENIFQFSSNTLVNLNSLILLVSDDQLTGQKSKEQFYQSIKHLSNLEYLSLKQIQFQFLYKLKRLVRFNFDY